MVPQLENSNFYKTIGVRQGDRAGFGGERFPPHLGQLVTTEVDCDWPRSWPAAGAESREATVLKAARAVCEGRGCEEADLRAERVVCEPEAAGCIAAFL